MILSEVIETHVFETLLGSIRINATQNTLLGVYFVGQKWEPQAVHHPYNSSNPIVKLTLEQLNAYFSGRLFNFDLPLGAIGTAFQRSVWQQIATINLGQSLSYGEIAKRIGRPLAARAVGAATGRNPIGIIIPCHRVMGGSGALTGYAGGLEKKRWLLAHESKFSQHLVDRVDTPIQESLI